MVNMVWEEIMQKAPFMKGLVERKIAEEVAKKDAEIKHLKQDKQVLAQNVLDLTTVVEELISGGVR